MIPLACGLELILIAKIVALILGALGLTRVAAESLEGDPCSDDC